MKKFLIIILGLTLTIGATAQNYKSAFGIKVAYNVALTYKTYISETNSLDFNVNFEAFKKGYFGVSAQGFYLWDFPIVDNLNAYVGPGASVGIGMTHSDSGTTSAFSLMVNCELGIEYKIPTAPVAISLDWTPGIGLAGSGFGYGYYGGGLGIKYTF